MVRALLDPVHPKTQTRRVLRLVGTDDVEEGDDRSLWPWSTHHDDWYICPFGAPRDRLWVREAWAIAPGVHAPHDWRDVL